MNTEAKIEIYRLAEIAHLSVPPPLTIILDNKKIGAIARKERKSFTVPAGRHKIFLRHLFFTINRITTNSIDIDLNPGECRSFECGPVDLYVPGRKGIQHYWWLILPLLIPFFLNYLGVLRVSPTVIWLTAIPAILLMFIANFTPGFVYYLKEVDNSNL
jgi:hypothetical protein